MKAFINTDQYTSYYDSTHFIIKWDDGFIKLLIEDPEYIVEAENVNEEKIDEAVFLLKSNIDIVLRNNMRSAAS
jgi:hypothetical protein